MDGLDDGVLHAEGRLEGTHSVEAIDDGALEGLVTGPRQFIADERLERRQLRRGVGLFVLAEKPGDLPDLEDVRRCAPQFHESLMDGRSQPPEDRRTPGDVRSVSLHGIGDVLLSESLLHESRVLPSHAVHGEFLDERRWHEPSAAQFVLGRRSFLEFDGHQTGIMLPLTAIRRTPVRLAVGAPPVLPQPVRRG